jgi:hypothetical protein
VPDQDGVAAVEQAAWCDLEGHEGGAVLQQPGLPDPQVAVGAAGGDDRDVVIPSGSATILTASRCASPTAVWPKCGPTSRTRHHAELNRAGLCEASTRPGAVHRLLCYWGGHSLLGLGDGH